MSSLLGNNVLVGASGQKPYSIDNSVRFNPSDNAVLTRTWGASDSLTTWTVSCWVKRSGFGALQYIFTSDATASGVNGTKMIGVDFSSGDALDVGHDNGTILTTSQVFRDPSAWFHLCLAFDTTQSTDSDRVKLYINGEQVTAFSTANYPAEDSETGWPKAQAHYIGESRSGSYEFGGYIAEFYGIDGVQLTPESFGELDSDTNQWVPKKYAGSYGTNGFYQKYGDSSALGADSSGNDNTFTVSGLVATDQMIDTPTNNFCTLNPVVFVPGTGWYGSEGNLSFTRGADDAWGTVASTMAPGSGKWYFEGLLVSTSGTVNTGIGIAGTNANDVWRGSTNGTGDIATVKYDNGGVVSMDGSALSPNPYGATYAAGDIIGVVYDMDASPRTCAVYKNNTIVNAAFDLSSNFTASEGIAPLLHVWGREKWTMNFGQDSSFAGAKTAQGNQDGNGKGDFYYEPPSGYLALCTDNLSTPEIALPEENFIVVKYNGNSSSNAITTGMAPDLVWLKSTDSTYYNQLYDSVRGVNRALYSNEVDEEFVDDNALMSFDSTGFTLGSEDGANDGTKKYVSWNWKAGGASSANDDGSLDSTVSVNTTAGFSIVKYSGVDTPATNTVGHGLSVAPELYVIKSITAASPQGWVANTTMIDGTVEYMFWNEQDGHSSQGSPWSTLPTSSVFTLGANDGNTCNAGVDYIAYCFHGVDGYSKIGTYVGNGEASNNAFIYLGFRPAYIWGKWVDGNNDWWIQDNKREGYNITEERLKINGSTAQENEYGVDLLSNGVKIRSNSGGIGQSGRKFLYMAFAESPFKTANAR